MSDAQARAIARNRLRKVAKLGEFIWARLTPDERLDLTLVDRVRNLSQGQRETLAKLAGTSVPSDDTMEALSVWIETQVKCERGKQGYYGRPGWVA